MSSLWGTCHSIVCEEALQTLDFMQHKDISLDSINLTALMQELEIYFVDIIYARYGYTIQIQMDDQRANSDEQVRINKVSLITAIRNLIADATVHGDYAENSVTILITLIDGKYPGYSCIQVTNPIQLEEEKLQDLCQGLGRERIVLTKEGNVEKIPPNDILRHGYHGNGKLSVARTWQYTLGIQGVSQDILQQFREIHWQYRPMTDPASNEFMITCTFPLKNAKGIKERGIHSSGQTL